jgi:hypothetical protein
MRPEIKLHDLGTDDSGVLPGGKVFVALAVLGLLFLGSAAFYSARVASPAQRVSMASKPAQTTPYVWSGFESPLDP